MPTFHDPLADAAEASEALRGLAHASRVFENPADTYRVFGELATGLRSLRQVLDQLGGAHLAHQGHAHDDDGNHAAGAADALAAADELHLAGTLLDQAEDRLSAAHSISGRIAWHLEPAPERRWLNVIFLQGEDADQVLDVIDRDGADAAIAQLAGYDYGEETTQAALENGYAYDTPPVGPLDRTVTEGEYTLTYNADLGHVSLLRAYTPPPESELQQHESEPGSVVTESVSAREAISGVGAGSRHRAPGRQPSSRQRPVTESERDWFTAPPHRAGQAGRGLSL